MQQKPFKESTGSSGGAKMDERDETAANQPKRLPKGVVLGKDGKPCLSCTSFAAWAAQAKDRSGAGSSATEARATASPTAVPCSDGPPDVERLGRSTWTLLHSIAASYPETPSRSQQSDLTSFVGLFAKLYPCWMCAEDFQSYLRREAPRVGSRDEFGKWLCGAHNDVNRKLGKPQFDCSKWEQRWRAAWTDGHSD